MEDFNDKRQPNRTKLPRAPRNNAQRRPRRAVNPQPAETESAVEVVVQPSRPAAFPASPAHPPQSCPAGSRGRTGAAAESPPRARRPAGRNHMQAVEGPAGHPHAHLPAGRPGRSWQEHHPV